jgi:anti-anti-sigma factor
MQFALLNSELLRLALSALFKVITIKMAKALNIIEFEIWEDMGVLTLRGEIDRKRQSVLKEALMVSLENSQHILINMELVTSIDDQCLQIIDAARERARTMNKRMAFCGLDAE